MAARTGGISGLAVTMAAAGAYLVYAGVQDVPLLDGLRDVVQGRTPAGRPKQKAAGGGSSWINDLGKGTGAGAAGGASAGLDGAGVRGDLIVNAARRYLGVPYRWGGNDPATGIDCSRLVQLAYGAAGITVPRTSAQMAVWPKFRRLPLDQVQPGDVLWWLGHVAVAAGGGQMIEAPTFGIPVRVAPIRKQGGLQPVVLRYVG